MQYWPWWLGGAALSSVVIVYYGLTRHCLGISSRYTALVDALREGAHEEEQALDETAMLEALRAATAAEFGEQALAALAPDPPADADLGLLPEARGSWRQQTLFLVGLLLGGAAGALLGGHFQPGFELRGETFHALLGGSPLTRVGVLFAGGLLVGLGTRMAGGCTSGHGLCGVSRLQPGSLLSTCAFFGTGIVVSLALGWAP